MSKEFKTFLQISIDDIYIYANDEMKVKLTKKEAEQIYDDFDSTDVDCENSTFWGHIELLVNTFIEEKD